MVDQCSKQPLNVKANEFTPQRNAAAINSTSPNLRRSLSEQ